MKLYSRIFICVVIVLIYGLYGCSNESKIEITQKREVSSIEKGKTITPLPASQRLRLLPSDLNTSSENINGQNILSSPETITTQKEDGKSEPTGKDTVPSSIGGFDNLELKWTVPEGWNEDKNKPMRVVTFFEKGSQWECYISVLLSQAGGIEANFKRWSNQMGKSGFNTQEIENLPEITILGKKCKLIDITGDYTDMQGTTHKNYRLLGAVCPLEEKTIFIKMTGPEEQVSAQKDKFIQLCNSIQLKN